MENKFNETLHKQSLARKRLIRELLASGKKGREVAKMLGISHQRVYQLRKVKPK